MAEIDIHGHTVVYDDTSHTMRAAVQHLKEKLDSTEAKPVFDEARRDLQNHKAHFEFRDHARHLDRNATLLHKSDGKYELIHRHHSIFG
jgi:hypothetical protein